MKSKMIEMEPDNTDSKEPEEHEVKAAAEDMMRAEAHKANPKMMKAVHEHLHGKAKAIKSIQDLKDARDHMNKKESDKAKM